VVSVDRPQITANGEDLAYVTVELVDAQGVPVYARSSEREVRVRVSGAGTLAGLGNGDPRDASSFQSGKRQTFHGRAVAVVRAGTTAGPIVVEVDVDGLPTRQVQVHAVSGRLPGPLQAAGADE
jgi:beta-galactosidase